MERAEQGNNKTPAEAEVCFGGVGVGTAGADGAVFGNSLAGQLRDHPSGTKTRAEKHVTEEDGERYANSAEGEGFADDVSSSPNKWAMNASSASERLTIFQGAVRVDLYGLQ